MLYRRFPKIAEKEISVLGLGCMRLPTLPQNDQEIDVQKAFDVIKTAYENGINYFDTAYVYHYGKSEVILGQALKQLHIREKIFIADKMPVWDVHSKEDWERIFSDQLARLQTDYIDFYLMHALTDTRWDTIQQFDGMSFLEQKKREGKIKHIGFSFHDTHDAFLRILEAYPKWEFCQIQWNYLDENYQAGLKGLQKAAEKGLGVIAMEPLRGGFLANPPQQIIDIFAHAEKPRLPAEWALRWVWENQHIVTALSGMNSVEQVLTNCAFAGSGKPNSLPQKQLAVIAEAKNWLSSRIKNACTNCLYCLPCPSNVAIPEIFALWNEASLKGQYESHDRILSVGYKSLLEKNKAVDNCISCKSCEKKCPQHISIIEDLKKAQHALTV